MELQPHYLNRPIFINGFQKSGTTLLLALLDGHPQLVVFPEELHFFQNVMFARDKEKAIRQETGFKMFLSHWNSQRWTPGESTFREGYPEFDRTEFDRRVEKAFQNHKSDKDLLLQLIEAFAQVDHVDPTRKSHWVSKTPRDEIFFPVMSSMFGNQVKLVFIVRDPRDVYLSISRKRDMVGESSIRNSKGLINFTIYWKTQINRVIHLQQKHKNIGIFRFEDLLVDTEKTLRRLCEFLQIDFYNDMLQPTRHGKPWGGNSVFSDGFEALSREPIGRFQKFLDPERRAQLEQFLSKELVRLGYETSESLQTGATKNEKVPRLNYWIPYLRYQRWYFSTQYSAAFRYSFAQLFSAHSRAAVNESSNGEQFRASSN